MSQQVNLYQPIFRKEEKKFSTVAMLQAMGLVVVGVVAIYAYTWWQVGTLKIELKRAEQQQAAASKRLADATEKFGQRPGRTSLDGEITHMESEIVAKQRIQEILQRGIFSNTRGFSDYFVSFARQYTPGVWLTGFDITGAAEQMTLAGRSTNPELVPRYMQKLSAEKTLSGIEFRVFQMNRPAAAKEPDARYVEFQVKTSGNPG
ncbi:PilN domain-containing protein [Sulfuricaulis sp.]|uniref:PilN domain-containing protein n=1 Tax=Sulfuricaulis sp. TaxID=2003553 RepID=UPI00355A8FAF